MNMKIVKTILVALVLALFGAMFASGAKADDWNKKTKVTFSQPVEIPGQILPAGTYTIKLVDSPPSATSCNSWMRMGSSDRHGPGDQQLAASSHRENRNQVRGESRR